MVIVLILIIPVCIIATGILVLKSVQLGLKWRPKGTEEPKKKAISPVVETAEGTDVKEVSQYTKEQIREWMFGPGE